MFWLKVCIYSHTRGVKLGLGLGMQRYHFFRSDPIRSRKFWVSANSDPILEQVFFFFFFLCVKHNLLDNFILMKNNMEKNI